MKKVKVTNRYLLNRTKLLSMIIQEKLPVLASYAITKNVEAINDALKPFNKVIGKVRNKFAKKDDKGEPICDKKTGLPLIDDVSGCNEEINKLLDIEVEINVMQFKIANLGNATLSGAELDALKFMIEDF
ncbi:hypothetical protein phiCTP1_gp25 [Clostridium phage phiCTP1]|uniref:hypothetical protein n=1 Tax=Clostridium phage phiCTP1 TaxID=871584 RepID=UPI0001E07827|nr:hypothetical protein phiCTP1_gp25 [Clostridium phage phiCTP1]ADL40326.1 hypothetical phage protein [Clostridium phage phiCTP1]WMU07957.1 hypothetical protein vBCtySFA88_00025 [Clostridium phage vB_CtyS-FA88]